MRTFTRPLLIGSMTLLMVVFNLPSMAGAADSPGAPDVTTIVSTDMVGVVEKGLTGEDVKNAGIVVTWLGTEEDSSTRVLWTSEPIELEDGLVAEHVGELTEAEVLDIRSDLDALGLLSKPESSVMTAAGAWGWSGVVCSLVIPFPTWDPAFDRAITDPSQVCSGHASQKVSGWLHMNTWLAFWTTKEKVDPGIWTTAAFQEAVMGHPCDSEGPKNWRTRGHGEAISPLLVFFDGPTATTSWVSLGCLG